MRKRIFQLGFSLVLALATSIPVLSQSDVSTATIKGTITDANNAVIAGATVTAKSLDKGISRVAKTDSEGNYQITTLQPGTYSVAAEATGFSTSTAGGVELTVGRTLVLDLQLSPGGVKSEVTVTTEAPLIEVERTQQANTIEKRQIENLPNVSRDFAAYVYTLPGIGSSNAPRAQGGARFTFASSGFSIGGSNGRNNLVTVDGGENEYGSGGLRFTVNTEAIQEFQVNRNAFTAEFGFTAGTAINVVTKSGSNQFHGSGYFFYRSEKTSARNFFDFNAEKAKDRQIYPGFTFGGPISKNKLFFFTSYERQIQDAARFRTFVGNSLLQPSGTQTTFLNTLANNNASNANLQRIITNLRSALTTNSTTYPTTFKLLQDSDGTFNGLARLNTWNTRVDYQPTDRDSINGRFTMSRNFTDDIGNSVTTSPGTGTTLTYRDYSTVITWIHNFGASLTNQARVQFSPHNSAVTAPRSTGVGATIASLVTLGKFFGSPYIVSQNRYQYEDNLTWIRGNHTFKFGGSYRPVSYNFRNDLWFAGLYVFSSGAYSIAQAVPAADQSAFCTAIGAASLATCLSSAVPASSAAGTALTSLQSFDRNLPTQYRQGFNNSIWQGRGHYFGGFAQDTWKVHPRLTLDIGGRIDYDGEPQPVPRHAYFSPRLGFAWDVTGNHKTVVRGGGGLFYSPIYVQIPGYTSVLNGSGKYINQIFRTGANAIFVWQAGVAQGKYPLSSLNEGAVNALGIPTGPGLPGRVIFDLDENYKNNYAVQASFGIQRELTNNLSLEVAYQMYHGLHLQQPVPLNYCEAGTPGCPATAANLTQLATRDPRLGPLYRVCSTGTAGLPDTSCKKVNDAGIIQFTNYESRGTSIYHGMTVSLNRRFSDYFLLSANYTFSKAIDDNTDFASAFAPPFPTRLTTERALSVFDIRHNFVFSGVFESPFKNAVLRDIRLSPSIFIRTGVPFSLQTSGTDLNSDTRSDNERLFNVGRNTGLGPNYRSVNLALRKAFRFKADSQKRIEVSADAANVFNRTNFSAVRDILPVAINPATGVITSISPDYATGVRLKGRRDRDASKGEPLGFTNAFNPRQILFGVKFAF